MTGKMAPALAWRFTQVALLATATWGCGALAGAPQLCVEQTVKIAQGEQPTMTLEQENCIGPKG